MSFHGGHLPLDKSYHWKPTLEQNYEGNNHAGCITTCRNYFNTLRNKPPWQYTGVLLGSYRVASPPTLRYPLCPLETQKRHGLTPKPTLGGLQCSPDPSAETALSTNRCALFLKSTTKLTPPDSLVKSGLSRKPGFILG